MQKKLDRGKKLKHDKGLVSYKPVNFVQIM